MLESIQALNKHYFVMKDAHNLIAIFRTKNLKLLTTIKESSINWAFTLVCHFLVLGSLSGDLLLMDLKKRSVKKICF